MVVDWFLFPTLGENQQNSLVGNSLLILGPRFGHVEIEGLVDIE